MLHLAGVQSFCDGTAGVWGVIGWFVVILKIIIPLILIVMGMIDLGKAVISSKEDAINKAVTTLIKRFIAAVVVFFVPSIVSALFSATTSVDLTSNNVNKCVQCVVNVAGQPEGYCRSKTDL